MTDKCQWLYVERLPSKDDSRITVRNEQSCTLEAVGAIRVPICLGGQATVNLCQKHKAVVMRNNAGLRVRGKGGNK